MIDRLTGRPRRSLGRASLALVPLALGVACGSTFNENTRSSTSPITLAGPAQSVLTQHNDVSRDGAYTTEGTLKPANVKGANPECFQQAPVPPAPGSSSTTYNGAMVASNCYSPGFGEIAVRPTVGDMAAQPLYAHGVTTTRGLRNLAIAATRENYIYAFDADSVDICPTSYTVWSGQIVPGVSSLQQPIGGTPALCGSPVGGNLDPCGAIASAATPACPNAIPSMVIPFTNGFLCKQTKQHVGITSTPVIDPTTGYMYVVYRTGTPPGIEPVQAQYWLRAINLYDGTAVVLPNQSSPDVLIQGADSIPARGGGEVVFDPVLHLNRPGLLLQNDPATQHPILYVAFGSAACDSGGDPQRTVANSGADRYHPLGWVFAYDLRSMQSAAFSTLRDDPQKYGDTIWQSGNGLLGDGQYVYFFTGNAMTTSSAGNYSGGLNEALVRLQATVSSTSALTLNFVSHWQDPDANVEDSNSADADLGASGPMIVPGTRLIAGGGKPGTIFTFNSTTLLQRQPLAAVNTYCPFPNPNPNNCSNPPNTSGVCPCTKYDTSTDTSVLTYEESQVWGPNIHVGLVGWQSANGNSYIYSMAEKDYLRSYRASATGVNFNSPLTSPIRSNWGMPGGHLSVSGNGGVDGIVWALHYEANDKTPDWVALQNGTAPQPTTAQGGITSGTYDSYHGVLYALDAVNLGMLYKDDAFHSEVPATPGRPICSPGTAGCCTAGTAGCGQYFAKFTPPTIADGKVFRPTYTGTLRYQPAPQMAPTGTYTGELLVYGQNSIAPTVVTNSRYGEMVAFEVDEFRTLNFAVQSSPSMAFGGWLGLSGNVKSSPAALDLGNGQVEIYFVSGNNAMFCAVGTAVANATNPVFDPQSPDGMVGQFNYSPALIKSPTGSGNDVFAVTTAGTLVYASDNGACGISGWQVLPGGPYASTPAVARNANGVLEVFLLDNHGSMWSISQSGMGWTATKFVDGTDFASGPVVGYEQNGEIAVFAVDAGGGLRHIWQTSRNGPFTAWSAGNALLGAPFSMPPAIASNADGTIEILAIDGNGNFQRQRESEPNAETWASSWETLAIGCTSAPAIGHNSDGRLEAFGICPDKVNGANVWGLKHTWQITLANQPNEFAAGLSSFGIGSWPPWQAD
jgi:hypothetical protein